MSRRVTSKLQLERVLGLTSLHQGALAVDPMTGNVVYAAGCIAVLFDPHKGRQVQFILAHGECPLTILISGIQVRFYRADNPVFAISFSPNGQYIAVGEVLLAPAMHPYGPPLTQLSEVQHGICCRVGSQDRKVGC